MGKGSRMSLSAETPIGALRGAATNLARVVGDIDFTVFSFVVEFVFSFFAFVVEFVFSFFAFLEALMG